MHTGIYNYKQYNNLFSLIYSLNDHKKLLSLMCFEIMVRLIQVQSFFKELNIPRKKNILYTSFLILSFDRTKTA